MQWQNFAKFATLNLGLGPCLAFHIGPPLLQNGGSHPEFTFQQWVEQKLDYLAVRPYETLDLQDRDHHDEGDVSVHYAVWYHIGNETRPFSYLRSPSGRDGNLTVGQTIDEAIEWHGAYWAKQENRPLVLDAIVRHKRSTPPGEAYYHESLEIFLVPRGHQPN